jgi:hypothetical protein
MKLCGNGQLNGTAGSFGTEAVAQSLAGAMAIFPLEQCCAHGGATLSCRCCGHYWSLQQRGELSSQSSFPVSVLRREEIEK